MMNEHEAGFLNFVEDRQARRIGELFESGEKARGKLRGMLPHKIILDQRVAYLIPSSDQTVDQIHASLLKYQAPEKCYLISENTEIDATEMTLLDALQSCVGVGFGTFVSCIPGKLGYYEFEGMKERYLLRCK